MTKIDLSEYRNVSRETSEELETYVHLLLKWNQKINLIGRSTEDDIWQRHIKDSIQLNQYIPEGVSRLIDLGTGAGLPGIVIAILRKDVYITLVESNTKKTSFLLHIKQQLKLNNVTIINKRIESIKIDDKFDVITSRALASLSDLFAYTIEFSQKNTLCIFPKGSKLEDEIKDAKQNWLFEEEIRKSEVEQNSYIMLVRNIIKRST